jgi:hypothetical protein
MTFDNTITIGQDGLKTRVFVVRNEYCFNLSLYQLVDIKITDKSKEDNWSTGTFIAGELVYENIANPDDKVIVEFVAFYNDLEITGQRTFVYKKDSDKFAYDIIFNSDKVTDGPIIAVKTTMNYTIEDFK